MPTVALSGASGFVGRQVLRQLLQTGVPVRALVRNLGQLPPQTGLSLIEGHLNSPDALGQLVEGASAVIHLAGATGGRDFDEFAATNVRGTQRLLDATERLAPQARFIHLSSLAARHPELSDYAASKAAGEQCVRRTQLDWVILRPPAVYGPDDPALAPLWQALSRGWLIRTGPAHARFSLLHVDDLASALLRLSLTATAARHETLDLHDGHEQGYGWENLKAIARSHRGRPVRTLAVPPKALQALGWFNLQWARMRQCRPPPLVPGKVRELVHHNWVCDNTSLPGCPDWTPHLTLSDALDQLPGWRRSG